MRVSYRCKAAIWVTAIPKKITASQGGYATFYLFAVYPVSQWEKGNVERGRAQKMLVSKNPSPVAKNGDTRHINKKAAYRTLSRRNNRVNHLAGKGGIGRGEARRIT